MHFLEGVKIEEDICTSSDDESDEIDEDNFFNHVQKKINKSPLFCLPSNQQMVLLLFYFFFVLNRESIRSTENIIFSF